MGGDAVENVGWGVTICREGYCIAIRGIDLQHQKSLEIMLLFTFISHHGCR
jgi:hypothetical protein